MPVFVGLISILGALIVNVSFDAEKVAFHGMVGKNGEVSKCEVVKPQNRDVIVKHIKFLQEHNSVNGQEHLYETGNVYVYEFFNRLSGGQVFSLTKKECNEGIIRILIKSDNRFRNG